MEVNPIEAISAEGESAAAADNIGMFTVKTANRTLSDASKRPNPDPLYHELWYEGEVCCLFSDSNLGKSIYAVQMAEDIALNQNVLLVDCELSDKQFQMRYTDPVTKQLHPFPEGLYRAEINPMSLDVKDYEEKILEHIVEAMHKFRCKVAIIDNLTYLCNSSSLHIAGARVESLVNLFAGLFIRAHMDAGGFFGFRVEQGDVACIERDIDILQSDGTGTDHLARDPVIDPEFIRCIVVE